METRKQYIEKLAAKLHEWDAKIDELRARAETASDEAKLTYKKQIVEIRELRGRGATMLEELHEAGETAWRDVKRRADRLIEDVKDIFKKAA